MIVIATGVSGVGKVREHGGAPGYMPRLVEFAEREIESRMLEGGWSSSIKRIRMVDVGKRMLERARDLGMEIRSETILDMSPEALQQLRAVVLTEVVNDDELWDAEAATIIVTHAAFWWKGHLIPGLDTHYLKLIFDETRRRRAAPQPEAIQESLPLRLAPPVRPEGIFYTTIVDSVYQINRRLNETEQWRGQVPTNELIMWQEFEVFLTEMFANYERVPHYLIAHDEPVQTLFDLICFKRPRIYLGYPITNLRREGLWSLIEEARAFARRLRDHFVVFDPLSVKDEEAAAMRFIGQPAFDAQFSPQQRAEIRAWAGSLEEARDWALSLDERTRLNLGRQTVIRDLRLIDQSDMNVVFYPTSAMSFGVLSEMVHAHTTGKKVYVIYPFKSISPFFEYNATRVIRPGPDDAEPRTAEEVGDFMARASEQVLQDLLGEHEPVE